MNPGSAARGISHPMPPDGRLLAMANGYLRTQLLGTAAALLIPELVQDGPCSPEQLADATNTRPQPLRRFLRALATMGVLAETETGAFAATELSEAMRAGGSRSVRGMILWHAQQDNYLTAAHLLHTLRTGEGAFQEVFGAPYFEWLEAHPEAEETLRVAGDDLDLAQGPEVVRAYDFARFRSIVDVGGNRGHFLRLILSARPETTGIVFDMPSVVSAAREASDQGRFGDRLRFAGGDFFAEVPAGHDAYVIRNVLHSWDDEHATGILSNCRKAMAPEGRVLVIERLAPERGIPSPFAEASMLIDMLELVNHTGRQRTEREYADLFAAAGLEPPRITLSPTQVAIVEASRP